MAAEGTYSVTNNEPIVPRVFMPSSPEDKKVLIKVLDRLINDGKDD